MVKVKKGKLELKLQFDEKRDNFTIGGRKMTKVGETKTVKTKNGRKIKMRRIAKTGFPQWRIISNKKA